ncbi:MAG: pantoate--beta-alanine ligase [Bacteroidales bacterium]|nr:pantoate--beta-alanine ligase [Bacteroidales bacterium]
MQETKTIRTTRDILKDVRDQGRIIGFVPTMGALHEGHLELIRTADKECDFVVASIFVNPIQFNNREDLEKYPRTLEEDLRVLEKNHCHLVFIPEVEEMYPGEVSEDYDFGKLEKVMEGKHRPGHFNGVAIVVKKLFDIVEPDKAYFGQKDYQQLLIIQKLVEKENLDVEIIPGSTVREKDGLAMSSRNTRLTQEERQIAPLLYQTLLKAADMVPEKKPGEIIEWARQQISAQPEFSLEYFEIADAGDLLPVKNFINNGNYVICLAAHLGNVRLIDNVIINS